MGFFDFLDSSSSSSSSSEEEEKHIPHIPLTLTTITSTSSCPFQEKRHSAKDLMSVITEVSSLRSSALIKPQRRALRNYQTSSIFNLTGRYTSIPDILVLQAYKRFFSDLFFFGLLDEKKVLIVLDERDTKESSLAGYAGKTASKWYQPPSKSYTITLLTKSSLEENRRKRLTWYISVLLHEMIHVFLQLFTCRREECYLSLDNVGKTGHGFAFQQIAFAVEKAVGDKRFLDLKLDLNRCKSLAQELVKSRVEELPGRLWLERWELSCRNVEEQVKYYRSEEWKWKIVLLKKEGAGGAEI